jgi:hypothetical protein
MDHTVHNWSAHANAICCYQYPRQQHIGCVANLCWVVTAHQSCPHTAIMAVTLGGEGMGWSKYPCPNVKTAPEGFPMLMDVQTAHPAYG